MRVRRIRNGSFILTCTVQRSNHKINGNVGRIASFTVYTRHLLQNFTRPTNAIHKHFLVMTCVSMELYENPGHMQTVGITGLFPVCMPPKKRMIEANLEVRSFS